MSYRIHQIERVVALALCLGLVLGTAVRHLGRWHWAFELTTHFVVQATLVAGLVALLLFARRHWGMASFAACVALVHAWEWMPYHRVPSPDESVERAHAAQESLVVVSANVLSRNHDSTRLDRWLIDADVAFISEVDPWWAAQLETWKGDWPYQILHPRTDNFGLALLSRYPITEAREFELEGGNPAVEARIRAPLGEWTLVGLHPFPPAGGTYSGFRNQQLASAADRIERLPRPRIVLGDLNSTSASPTFRDFLARTGLRDTREGFGWQPTWPAGNRLLRIPIDHILVDREFIVVEREVGPDIGSDHLPVRARLTLRTGPGS